MKRFGKVALGVLMMAGAATVLSAPARADVSIGFSFGDDGYYPGDFSDPCDYYDYYDYYDAPPPWGLPPDYCDYPVYFEPVYWDGYWYRGPIYYRWYGGQRLYWLNGGWHRDEWRGPRPQIRWQNRGGHFYRGGRGGDHSYGNRFYYHRGYGRPDSGGYDPGNDYRTRGRFHDNGGGSHGGYDFHGAGNSIFHGGNAGHFHDGGGGHGGSGGHNSGGHGGGHGGNGGGGGHHR
ncbi:MAG: hypothetical protein KGJ78_09920 [Alphaproteobacteria bacterium]|nr:hypothetical protein [Alphaproteobacteria bacterium]